MGADPSASVQGTPVSVGYEWRVWARFCDYFLFSMHFASTSREQINFFPMCPPSLCAPHHMDQDFFFCNTTVVDIAQRSSDTERSVSRVRSTSSGISTPLVAAHVTLSLQLLGVATANCVSLLILSPIAGSTSLVSVVRRSHHARFGSPKRTSL